VTGDRRQEAGPVSTAPVLSAEAVRAAARAARFRLVGLAPATPLDPAPLESWLAAGYAADMTWMARRLPERLDPAVVLPGARTVIALALAYHRPAAETAAVARYARGRDYHYAHRDGMRALRKRLLALDPTLETYASVDTGVVMEKAWAERAGLGWIGKNGCLINPQLGSWLTLSVMFIDRAVDAYDAPHQRRCGDCALCLAACPTSAFAAPGVVDARRCIAYQSIENRDQVPEALRAGFAGRIFGCDVCQEVCPWNQRSPGQDVAGPRVAAGPEADPLAMAVAGSTVGARPRGAIPTEGDARFSPRPLSTLSPAEVAALTPDDFQRQAAGMALARARYDGLRRNALYAIGSARDRGGAAVVDRLLGDPAPSVSEAARWAADRLAGL
jgi:epoxyqueuosine reductase